MRKLIIKNEKGYVNIQESLQNIYDAYVESSSKALFKETAKDCKDYANACRTEAVMNLQRGIGIPRSRAEICMSMMSNGDIKKAEKFLYNTMC